MEEHAALSVSASTTPSTKITSGKHFNCDQCDFGSDSQRGLKVHVGRSHKESEVLRAEEPDVSLTLSEMSDVRDDDSNVKADTSLGMEEQETAEPAHSHPDWVVCPRSLCEVMRYRLEESIKEKRPCNKCGANNEKECVCYLKQCENCNEGECCNKCCCCDGRDYDVTTSEWVAFFASMGMDLPSDYMEKYVPPLRKL